MIQRRALVAGMAAVVAPLRALGQPRGVPRIGYLGNGHPPRSSSDLPFYRGLRELGRVEGQTVVIEYRWAEGNLDRLPRLAEELVRSSVDVIVVGGTPAIRAAQSATSSIPIVFVVLVDPVATGVVQSLAHPGGNTTGLASQFEELITKQLALLKEAIPRLSRVALLQHDHPQSSPIALRAAETAARRLGLAPRTFSVADVAAFETAFRTARSDGVEAVQVMPHPFFGTHRQRLIELAAKYRLPAAYEFKNYVEEGGLMSYGPSINDMWRQVAGYVDRILKGAKPGDLPIERPTRFELVINLKTARVLNLTFPPSLLLRADQVIE